MTTRLALARVMLATAAVAVALSFAGCAGLAATIEQLGKDQTTLCAQASTPYGSASAIRAGLSGYRITSSGTGCTVESISAPR